MKLRFKIKHLMYLTLWTAIVLAFRDALIASVPDFVWLIARLSGVAAVGMFVGLYGIALMMGEGRYKDRLVNKVCYLLIGDGILFLLFSVTEFRF